MKQNSNLNVSFIRTVSLSNEERAEIMRVCCEAFGGPFDELFDLVAPTGVHVLARLDDCLVSHAVITERRFRIGDLPVMRAAYIDAVATLPGEQRKGYGSEVMRKTVEYASVEFDIAGLATVLDHWYGNMGWEHWKGELGLDDGGAVTVTENLEERVMIHRLPATPAVDVNARLIADWRPGGGW